MATRKKRAAAKIPGAAKKRSAGKPRAKKPVAKKLAARKSAAVASKRVAKKAAPRKRPVAKTAATKPKIAKKTPAPRAAASVKRAASARPTTSPAAPVVDTSLFPCGDAALRAATGKGWNEWLAVLDAAGAAAKGRDHQQIWDLTMQSLPAAAGWWGQMISVGYERARGLREKHETCAGDFQSTLSKTLPVPLFAAFAAWADEELRQNWLDAPGLDFTKLNAGKNIRARWPDGSLLDIRFNASGPDRCQIVVDTMKLSNAEAVQKAKAFWQQQFERLQAYFKI
jgi:hypothetical protein